MGKKSSIGISIVIPVFNAEGWIQPTIEHIVTALKKADFAAEIIAINDGSTDNSRQELEAIQTPRSIPLTIVNQKNRGRYLARKRGVEATKYENILFIDSRVFIDDSALRFLYKQLQDDSDQIWNGHVNIDKKGNLFARFWDAIVCIAWRKYFRKPRTTSYTLEEFDYYPKGTGFFYVPKARLLAAMNYFEANSNDLTFSSDDTLLIRFLIKERPVHLSPHFSCTYNSRSTFKGFLKHAYHRGQFFIDGFLRPGNRFFVPLLLVLAMSVAAIILLIMTPLWTLSLFAVGALLLMLSLFTGALLFGVILADAAALALLSVPFALVYGAGLWRGVVRKLVFVYNTRNE